jgi:hypothetical protein
VRTYTNTHTQGAMQRCDTHLLRPNGHPHRSQIPTCPPHAPFHSALRNRLLKSLRRHDGTEVSLSSTFAAVNTEARSICDLASLTAIVPCSGEAGASRTRTSNYQAAIAGSMPTLACVEHNSNPDLACRARRTLEQIGGECVKNTADTRQQLDHVHIKGCVRSWHSCALDGSSRRRDGACMFAWQGRRGSCGPLRARRQGPSRGIHCVRARARHDEEP